MRRKRVYISGEMSGLTRQEYWARFRKAELLLQDSGFRTVNPARFLPARLEWLYKLLGRELTLLYDMWRLNRCQYIYKIPGWKKSEGANIESCWAYHTDIWSLPTTLREKIDQRMMKFIGLSETSNKKTNV